MIGGSRQIPLPLGLGKQVTLEDYYPGRNGAALAAVRGLLQETAHCCVYLYGPAGVGKSHLLLGAAHHAPEWCPYLDGLDPEWITSMGDDPLAYSQWVEAPLLCVDHVDAWAGHPHAEMWLFRVYNARLRERRPMLLAGRDASTLIDWHLPDWASRMGACLSIPLCLQDDDEKIAILQEMSKRRGLRMDTEVALYLLRHQSRDLAALEQLLIVLDLRSWEEQRVLTIPFIRHCLETVRHE
ncbi:MAG: DnaA regulatory inactivator Hda [Acidithiobacillus sp.]